MTVEKTWGGWLGVVSFLGMGLSLAYLAGTDQLYLIEESCTGLVRVGIAFYHVIQWVLT